MTRKQRRAVVIAGGLAIVAVAVGLVLAALRTQVTFFMSPTEVQAKAPVPGTRFRLGGLVEKVQKGPGAEVAFGITDGAKSVPVSFSGILPDLFKEGQGAVAEGQLGPDGVFKADTVLAKHDEKYMPPEVAAALKKAGRWQEQGGKAGAAPGS